MKALAVLEGPWSQQMPGWRHYATIVDRGYPRMTLGEPWRAQKNAADLGLRFYPAGTWEQAGEWPLMPLPRPEILSEIMGTQQAEMTL